MNVPSAHEEPTYWNDNIQTHFFPLVALWGFSALGTRCTRIFASVPTHRLLVAAVTLRLLGRESLDYEERVYEWAVFGVTFISSICTTQPNCGP